FTRASVRRGRASRAELRTARDESPIFVAMAAKNGLAPLIASWGAGVTSGAWPTGQPPARWHALGFRAEPETARRRPRLVRTRSRPRPRRPARRHVPRVGPYGR